MCVASRQDGHDRDSHRPLSRIQEQDGSILLSYPGNHGDRPYKDRPATEDITRMEDAAPGSNSVAKSRNFAWCYTIVKKKNEKARKKNNYSSLVSVDPIITMRAGNRPLYRATHKFNMITGAGSEVAV